PLPSRSRRTPLLRRRGGGRSGVAPARWPYAASVPYAYESRTACERCPRVLMPSAASSVPLVQPFVTVEVLEQRAVDCHPDRLGERVADDRHDDHEGHEDGEDRNDWHFRDRERECDRERDREDGRGDADVDGEGAGPVARFALEVQPAARTPFDDVEP